jgi:hypothetical protein
MAGAAAHFPSKRTHSLAEGGCLCHHGSRINFSPHTQNELADDRSCALSEGCEIAVEVDIDSQHSRTVLMGLATCSTTRI